MMAPKISFASAFVCLALILAYSQEVFGQVTFAGTQFSVAGGMLDAPTGVAVDGKGNLFVADRGNNRVVELPISTNGFGAATTVLSGLSSPTGVAADWNGNIFVADTGNNRIVMLPVSGDGFGSAVAIGTGWSHPTGVAVDLAENLYVADAGNNRVVELARKGSGYGPPVNIGSGLNNPMGIAVDSGQNVFVADTGNNRVVREAFTTTGYPTQVIVGKQLLAPTGVGVDRNFNVYIADTGNGRVVKEPWVSNRFNTQIAFGSDFSSPASITTDSSGDIYIADPGSNQVMEVVSATVDFGPLSVGSAGATLTYNFNVAAGATIGSVEVYTQGLTGKDFVDAGGSSCIAQTYAAATQCGVNVGFAPRGSGARVGAITINDAQGNDMNTTFVTGTGMAPRAAFFPGTNTVLGSQLSGPMGVTVDASGNVYIADTGNNRVVEVPWNGSGYGAQMVVPFTGLMSPMGMAVDGAGNLFVVCNGNDKVVKLPWMGSDYGPQLKVGTGFYGPSAVSVDTVGNLYIADTLDNRVDKLSWTGSGYAAAQSIGNYRKFPVGVAVDGIGNVIFSMPYQNTVVKVPLLANQYQGQANLQLSGVAFPSATAIDANSNLYLVDTDNNRLLMLPWNGSSFGKQIVIATGFNAPSAIALDANGNIYIADTGNNHVVKIDISNPNAMGFADTYLGSTSSDSARTVIVENIGNQPLDIDSVSYPADFPEAAGAVTQCIGGDSVSQGSYCELSIDFTPLVIGSPLKEAVTITSNTMSIDGTRQVFSVSGTSLGKSNQTISFQAIPDMTYGSGPITLAATASSGLPVTYQVLSGPAGLSHSGAVLSLNGAGTVVVQAKQVGNTVYDAATPVTLSFVIAPAELTVTPLSVAAVYGAIPTSFNYTVAGFIPGQSAAQVVAGKAVVTANATSKSAAGSYVLTASKGTLSAANYTFVFVAGKLTVSKASLQVKAGAISIIYGGTVPALPWTLSGFVNGDTAEVISGTPLMESAASVKPAVGKYTITPSLGALSSANYNFTFVSSVLTVSPAVLTVMAMNQSMTYGAAVPKLVYTATGLATGDTMGSAIRGAPAITTKATNLSSTGTYAITVALGTLTATNYSFKFASGLLTVEKAVLTVTPNNVAMTYAGKVPTLPFNMTGFVNGDTRATAVNGSPTLMTVGTSKSQPGSFAISADLGSLSAKNYSFKFASGVLTIGKAVLTVKPQSVSMTYGEKLPEFAYDYAGFLNGDGVEAIEGKPLFTSIAKSIPAAGSYNITGAIGTLASKNYTFSVQSGKLIVNKAVLTITPRPASMVYGGAVPGMAFDVTGLVNGDIRQVVCGAASYKTNALPTSAVGAYPVTVNVAGLLAANYTFKAATGGLTVNKAVLTVTPIEQSMSYGNSVPKMTYMITGFVNGDTQAKGTTGVANISTSASSKSSVGKYSIGVVAGSLTAKNYSFQFKAGSMTVNKAPLTIAADNRSMKAGATVPPLTYTVKGLAPGDTITVATSGTPGLSTKATPTSAAGSYPIAVAQGTMKPANYELTLVNGSLTVTK